jgi:BirA family biotin operon repressor/biotin-[acetyl-CoA-carboxylase] ligase
VRVEAELLNDDQLGRLTTSRFGPVLQLAETTSTSSVLSAEAARGAVEGMVVLANYQSEGRGRFDRRWEAPPGTSLLFSVLLRPSLAELPVKKRHLAVACISLALVDGVRAVAGVALSLKWPNDLVVALPDQPDRKVAGILAETVASGGIVVGVGVNVAWAPEGLAATCLETLAGQSVDRWEVLVTSLLALDRLYGHWDDVARRYREACATVGREVEVKLSGRAADLHGTAVGLNDDGHLLVRTNTGEVVAVAAGDVTHAIATPASSLGGQ